MTGYLKELQRRNVFRAIAAYIVLGWILLQVGMFKVVIPLSAPGVFTAAILAFVTAWDEFLLALTLMSRVSMRTLSVGITLYQGEFAFPWPLISAALIIAIVPICVLIAVFQERVVGGLTTGGVKG
jgi:multiple sugar transport system permease protein